MTVSHDLPSFLDLQDEWAVRIPDRTWHPELSALHHSVNRSAPVEAASGCLCFHLVLDESVPDDPGRSLLFQQQSQPLFHPWPCVLPVLMLPAQLIQFLSKRGSAASGSETFCSMFRLLQLFFLFFCQGEGTAIGSSCRLCLLLLNCFLLFPFSHAASRRRTHALSSAAFQMLYVLSLLSSVLPVLCSFLAFGYDCQRSLHPAADFPLCQRFLQVWFPVF